MSRDNAGIDGPRALINTPRRKKDKNMESEGINLAESHAAEVELLRTVAILHRCLPETVSPNTRRLLATFLVESRCLRFLVYLK